MMGSFVEDDEEEYPFFDALEETETVISYSGSDCSEDLDSYAKVSRWVSSEFHHDVWVRSPRSVEERRSNFFNWLGFSSDKIGLKNLEAACSHDLQGEGDRITSSSGSEPTMSCFKDEFCPSQSSNLRCCNDSVDSSESLGSDVKFVCRIGTPNSALECHGDKLGQDGATSNNKEDSSFRMTMTEDFEDVSGSSLSFQEFLQRESIDVSNQVEKTKRARKGWLSRLRSIGCIMDKQVESDTQGPNYSNSIPAAGRVQRVRVRQCRKRLKELSALYEGQDFHAHKGSILTMKFSPDGQYLASAGEDGIVRLWQVVEDERSIDIDISTIDPSSMYFTVNYHSELAPLTLDKEKMIKLKNLWKSSDSACVIFPSKVFRILEKPLHQFHGHKGKILDLSWSNNNYLLSSSADNTVRLWRIGSDHCLQVFLHSNYVTCAQFNPVDEDFFMSGSIDGKVRIWATRSCQVVGWTDIKEIVTAVCYRPNAQGGLVGSISGNCRFYNISDNYLQLDASISLHSKKKSPCKRITGFQFFPQDESKVMVTCADSQVRILHGVNVIGKYKGLRNAGNQLSASFTSDGKHIMSTREDSEVCLWNCSSPEGPAISRAKSIRSCEHFSVNASIAIPWNGLKYTNSEGGYQFRALDNNSHHSLPFSSPACFSLGQEFLLESFTKGSATWPEEKLPTSSPIGATSSAVRKSQYKFLKTSCQSTSSSHAWGLVIVTAGWDGRIRSFQNYGLPRLT